jgi:hypothetical protein
VKYASSMAQSWRPTASTISILNVLRKVLEVNKSLVNVYLVIKYQKSIDFGAANAMKNILKLAIVQ